MIHVAENENKKYRACFTGHRPEKLNRSELEIKTDLETQIKGCLKNGIKVFISGMARGVDIWAAQIVLDLKNSVNDIKLICASPYEGFEKSWDESWRKQYKEILEKSDYIKYVCPHYFRGCYQVRNEWMVKNSSKVIAVYNGEKGGTKNTIKFAQKNNIPIILIEG